VIKLKTKGPVGRNEVRIYADVENEQRILAAMMRDRIILREMSLGLDSNAFIGERHKTIFRTLRDIEMQGLDFDLEAFSQIGRKRNYGGLEYLRKILKGYPDIPKNIDFHVKQLRTDSIKYGLRVGGIQELVDLTEDPTADLDRISDLVSEINRAISSRIEGEVKSGNELREYYLSDFNNRIKKSSFVPTGLSWLDEKLTEGLARQKMSIWTARPSIGKTTVAANIAYRLAVKNGKRVLYIPIEPGTISILDCMVSLTTGIHLNNIIKNPDELSAKKIKKIQDGIYSITENENLLFWMKSLRFEQLPALIRRHKTDVVIYDLWQQMLPDTEQHTIEKYLLRTRLLGVDEDVHQMLLHQTKRDVDFRKNKRPTRADLKGSGGYEENADLIIGLYRGKYYDKTLEEDIMEFGIPKQRRGSAFDVCYYDFDGGYGTIGDERRDYDGIEDYS
jgi:replicative DNA helicase